MTVSTATTIAEVTEADLPDLLPLVRADCDSYEDAPADEDLLALSQAPVADPQREGLQLLTRHSPRVGAAREEWPDYVLRTADACAGSEA